MRHLGFAHAKFVSWIGGLLCVVVAAGAPTAGASPVAAGDLVAGASPLAPATYGPARAWGGTEIRSLDPARITAAATDRTRHRDQVLSNENTFTRWAYVNRIAWIYQAPRVSSSRMGQLTWYTPDGFYSIYLLLRAHYDTHGQEWVKLRIPGRPNGRIGWVQRSALGSFHLTHSLVVVDREHRQLSFYTQGRRIWSAPVGVGKPGTPTPTGHFWIAERFKITDPSSGYYPYAFGTTDYSTLTEWPGGGVVGIHGPYFDPQGIPGYISHGCIRLHVSDDFWLAGHLQLGTPLRVQ